LVQSTTASHDAATPQLHSNSAWLIVVTTGVMAAIHIWKLPVALPVLESEFGMSLLTSGLLLGIIQCASMVGGLLIAWGGEMVGLRRLIIVGLLLLAAGSLLGATTTSIQLLLLYRGIEGIGFLLCTVLAPALIRRVCAPVQLNVALSAWGAFQGTATIVGFAAGGLLLEVLGWRLLWVALAVLTLLLIIPLLRSTGTDPHQPAENLMRNSGHRILTTVRTWRPWVAGLTFASYTLQWMAVMGFLPTVFAAADIAQLQAALLSAVVGGVNVIGALIAGRLLSNGAQIRHIVVATFMAMAITSLLFFAIDWKPTALGLTGQLICAIFFSMIGGTVPALLSRLAVDLAPPEGSVAAVIGLMQQIFNVGNFFGPSLLAWVVMITGSWNSSWWVTVSFSALGIACTLILTTGSKAKKNSYTSCSNRTAPHHGSYWGK